MKDKIMKILNHPVKGIYFLGIVAVYFLIVLTDFSFSFYTFLAYGQEIKEANLYKKYTLTYDSQGGSSCTSQTQYSGQAWGTLCAPTKAGYTFGGWYTETNGDGDEVTSSTNATQDVIVYADYYQNTLYDAIRTARKTGYAKKYIGPHQDSMDTSLSTENIYHWYGTNATAGTAILDKNNVIFADHCWQMIRTTDTGGVKMIYNGQVDDGKCLKTRGTHLGYNKKSQQFLNDTYYWYGTDYIYDSSNKLFTISGTTSLVQVTSSNAATVIPTLIGKYTCKSTTETGTCSELYWIDSYNDRGFAYMIMLNSNSNYSTFGDLGFKPNKEVSVTTSVSTTYYNEDSPAYVGYMYNVVYPQTFISFNFRLADTSYFNTNYYYSDTISYDSSTNKYTLTNPQLISTLSDINDLVGKYILANGANSSYTIARYIVGVNGTKIDVRDLKDGDLYTSMMIGDNYVDNGDGTYTVQNATPLTYIDWYNSSDFNQYKGKYVCDGTSATCSNLKHIRNNVAPTNKNYTFWTAEYNYKYSESVSYSNGTYTLTGDVQNIWDFVIDAEVRKLNTHHYTCQNNNTTCTTIAYANSYVSFTYEHYLYYLEFSGANNISEALTNMLMANDVNTNDSTIKKGVEAWYKKYLLSYDNYVDDTVYCNDRSTVSLGVFNQNGGDIIRGESNYLQFNGYYGGFSGLNPRDLSCANITDKFSVSNNSAKLTYKVGLATLPEMNLLNQANARVTGQKYWILSPSYYSDGSYMNYVDTNGSFIGGKDQYGVRPVISLKPGLKYSGGDGSMANPYVVDLNSLSS